MKLEKTFATVAAEPGFFRAVYHKAKTYPNGDSYEHCFSYYPVVAWVVETIIETKAGIPDLGTWKFFKPTSQAHPICTESEPGNLVMLKLSNGRFQHDSGTYDNEASALEGAAECIAYDEAEAA
jgi:hypothetical protein